MQFRYSGIAGHHTDPCCTLLLKCRDPGETPSPWLVWITEPSTFFLQPLKTMDSK